MTIQLEIENLKCGGCAATIKKGLLTVNNVNEVTVDVDSSIVKVISEDANLEEIKAKLANLGYPEVGDKNTLVHKAKSFVSCAVGKMDA